MSEQREHFILRLDAPMQSWGDVAMDPRRPTLAFPTRSALAGLLASALGWRYRDGDRTTALQDAIRYAVREERVPTPMRDFHTADLERIGFEGWTRWGMERRGGSPRAAKGTQILEKDYLAGGVFLVALAVTDSAPATLEELAEALQRPARPLFFGRKACIPASPIIIGRTEADSAYGALSKWPVAPEDQPESDEELELWCWYADGEGPEDGEPQEISDRRDFSADRFAGSRTVRRGKVRPPLSVDGEESGS